MTKEQADKIAQKIANDWKLFWMSQTQNSKQDYDNYFRRALAVDANMRAHLESLISAALVDASKVTEVIDQKVDDINQSVVLTECAEFEEWISKNVSFRDGTEPIWIKNQAHYAPTKALFEQLWNVAYLAGQKSKALKLPSFMEIEDAATNNYKLNAGLADTFYKGACWVLNEIKSLNEGK